MANDITQLHGLALHELLLSMAESLNIAQGELNNIPPYDEYGRQNTMYHLPYLDFNLKINTEFTDTSNTESKVNRNVRLLNQGPIKRARLLKVIPSRSISTNKKKEESGEIESSISGKFIAVMPDDSATLKLICTNSTPVKDKDKNETYTFNIITQVLNAANEPVPNATVEFNFDAYETANLNGQSEIKDKIHLSYGENSTDQNGITSTEVKIGRKNTKITSFCFIVNSKSFVEFISISIK